ncbi:hypothetical protein F4802DRAFT_597373 [Xylaria palmicola]|nr:hypothetical protein F4802DRAFT_597373 [Xylaria palmicola]
MGSAAADFKGLAASQTSGEGQSPAKSPFAFGGLYHDPRTSSTQSLTPSLPAYEEIERRKLLVIYVHGFMGNDTSFQSFPAHVHRYLKLALSDSHVVHSKIYPRYKTYKAIDVARDNFSKWLEPLEGPKTDVILVGHSMGGLLAADVVLKRPGYQDLNHHGYFKHRILGVVNLDAPLLGMHPGIIVSGISSLFRKNEAPKLPGEPSTQSALSPGIADLPSPNLSAYSVPSAASEASPSPPPPPAPFMRPALTDDANFNPNFPDDVRIKERTWWKNVVHFAKKHNSEGLINAATNHVMSHMEFGGSMFDFNSLKTRYESVRKLEDIDELKQTGGLANSPPQVRFIQYYTICNGFPKKPKEEAPARDDPESAPIHDDLEKGPPPPYMSVDGPGPETRDETFERGPDLLSLSDSERSSLEFLSPDPIPDEAPPAADGSFAGLEKAANAQPYDGCSDTIQASSSEKVAPPTDEPAKEGETSTADVTDGVAALSMGLPAVPEMPQKPDPPNLDEYADKDARKLAEKEAKRALKVYAQAVKDREKAIRDRDKIVEKRRKKLAQEAEKKAKEEKKRRKKEDAATASSAAAASASATATTTPETTPEAGGESKPTPPSTSSEREASEPPPAPEWTPVSPEGKKRKGKSSREEDRSSPYEEKEKGKDKDKGKGKEKEKEKSRKFCNVPKSRGRVVDPRWVSIFMRDMDEVAAHTGLFFAGEHYDALVGDVGGVVVEWVHADMSKRTILGLR